MFSPIINIFNVLFFLSTMHINYQSQISIIFYIEDKIILQKNIKLLLLFVFLFS